MIWLELRFDGQPVDDIIVNSIEEALDIMEHHSYEFKDQNEDLKEWWLKEGMNPNPVVNIAYASHIDKKCPRCGNYLYPPDVRGYQYTCYECDENFYECEVKFPSEEEHDIPYVCGACQKEEDKEMNYQEQIKKAVQEFYDVTKAFASSRHYTLSYWWVESNFGLDLTNKQVRDDVHEMSYSDEFCDLIQTVDFDDDKKEVLIMIWASNNKKKYTIDTYEEFCKNALQTPPIEDFEDGKIDEVEWYKENRIHITVGKHEIELDYCADNVNEVKYALREMYEAEYDGPPTTGNTIGSEYRNATWKDILRFAVLEGWYEDSHCMEAEVEKCIYRFTKDRFEEIMKKIDDQTSINDELEVNFFKLDSKDLWKIFDKEERRQAFKEILCSKVEISELVDKDGKHDDKVVIMDYSIIPSGDLVGWHYGVDFDKDSEDNQYYMQNYIDSMTK